MEDPLHLVTSCNCPELGHVELAAAMAEARTDAEAERNALGGLLRLRFHQAAMEDWTEMRTNDPDQALQLLLGTRDATERWLGDSEDA